MYKKIISAFFFLLLFGTITFSQQAESDNTSQSSAVTIAGTQLQKLHSNLLNRDFELYINLPRNYSDTAKKFPVVYLLDAQWDFPLVMSIYGSQYYDGFVPGAIIVGITWGGDHPNYDSLRAMDLTPYHSNQLPQSGNAPNFLKFIKQELIPFVEKDYRTDKTNRALMGSSFGGLFTLYAMFNETNLFNMYALTSPAITWANGAIYQEEEHYAKEHSDLPVRLYMAIGGYEDVNGFNHFADILKGRNYKNLKMETKVIEGMGHSGGKAEGFTRGMQFIFKRPQLKLDSAVLAQYTGTYAVAPGVNFKITLEDGHLIAHPPGNQRIVLNAQTEKDFYVVGSYVIAHFQKDADGKVTGFKLEQYSGENFVKKVN